MSKKTSFVNCCEFCGETYFAGMMHECLEESCDENQHSIPLDVSQLEQEDAFDIDEILISEVSKRPALYDSRLPIQQRSKVRLQDLWNEIHFILKDYMSLEDIKKRWRTIRDRYIRTKCTKYIPSGSAASQVQSGSKYKHAAIMSFIDDTIVKKKTVSNLGIFSGESSRSSTPFEQEEVLSPAASIISTPSGSGSLKRKRNDSSALESELLKKLKEPSPQPQVDKFDDVDHFCKSLASGLRKLDYRRRLQLQIKYMQLLEEKLD